MKFQKESFLAFLQSLKQGSVLIVAAIKKSTEAQESANERLITAAAKAQEKLDEIAGKKIDLHALESISQNIEESKTTLGKIQAAVEEKPSGEITISTPVKIEKPSWLSELKTPLSPILDGFAGLIGSLSTIKSLLEKIGQREIKLPLTKDGRIMVEVDRIGGGGGSKFSKEGLATEEKQDAIIAAQVAAIAAQNLGELAPILRSMLLYLTSPGYLDRTNNALRMLPIGGTVTTVTGLTNIDGYQGKLLILNQNQSAWASVVRARIS